MTSGAIHARIRHRDGALAYALAITGLFVFLTAYGQLWLTSSIGRVAAIWISNAILLAPMLRFAQRDWPKILLVGYLANLGADLAAHDALLQSIVLSFVNLIEVLTIAWPLRKFRLDGHFSRPRTLLIFYGMALGPAPLFSGFLAASFFALIGSSRPFWNTLIDWYVADALGLGVLVPLLMTAHYAELRDMISRKQVLVTFLLIGVMAAAIVLNFFLQSWPIGFLFFPAVLLLTFQRGFTGGTIGLAMAGTYMLARIFVGENSVALVEHSLRNQITIVQIFIAVMSFTVVLVGAALEERKRLERGLAAAISRAELSREEALVAKEAAEDASRAKSMFLANMSHELRTPLNAVLGFSELMRHEMLGAIGNPRYQEYLEMIHGAGAHLLDLINDILDMAKVESGKMELVRERVDAARVIGECVTLLQDRAHQDGLNLTVRNIEPGLMFDADRRAMKQILLNLVGNAIKFTPAGGQVVVDAVRKDMRVHLSVADTGIGIPAGELHRLGNPFVQLRNHAGSFKPGTGLGLALVRTLTEMHGGLMRIESVEGQGTTVTVDIPCARHRHIAAA